jgi:hypothetical protein
MCFGTYCVGTTSAMPAARAAPVASSCERKRSHPHPSSPTRRARRPLRPARRAHARAHRLWINSPGQDRRQTGDQGPAAARPGSGPEVPPARQGGENRVNPEHLRDGDEAGRLDALSGGREADGHGPLLQPCRAVQAGHAARPLPGRAGRGRQRRLPAVDFKRDGKPTVASGAMPSPPPGWLCPARFAAGRRSQGGPQPGL